MAALKSVDPDYLASIEASWSGSTLLLMGHDVKKILGGFWLSMTQISLLTSRD